jgi:hypothetical protein
MSTLLPMGRDNNLDTFYTPRAGNAPVSQKSLQERYFLLSFLSRLKYPKQRDIKRHPHPWTPYVGPWNNSRIDSAFDFYHREIKAERFSNISFSLVSDFITYKLTNGRKQFLHWINFRSNQKSCGKCVIDSGKYNPCLLILVLRLLKRNVWCVMV